MFILPNNFARLLHFLYFCFMVVWGRIVCKELFFTYFYYLLVNVSIFFSYAFPMCVDFFLVFFVIVPGIHFFSITIFCFCFGHDLCVGVVYLRCISEHTCMLADKQTYMLAGRLTDKLTDKYTERLTG